MWGGGIYQPSDEITGGYDFYSACDELGIFAWSELIFSDSLYPINDFILESVDPEVRQNVASDVDAGILDTLRGPEEM